MKLRLTDERTIYLIPPGEILLDVKRALEKVGLRVVAEARLSRGGWRVQASNGGRWVRVVITYERRTLQPLKVLGEIPITTLFTTAEGDEDFLRRLMRSLELSLLRCLG